MSRFSKIIPPILFLSIFLLSPLPLSLQQSSPNQRQTPNNAQKKRVTGQGSQQQKSPQSKKRQTNAGRGNAGSKAASSAKLSGKRTQGNARQQANSKPQGKPNPQAKSKAKGKPNPQSKSKVKGKPKTQANSNPQGKTKVKGKPKPQGNSKPQDQTKVKGKRRKVADNSKSPRGAIAASTSESDSSGKKIVRVYNTGDGTPPKSIFALGIESGILFNKPTIKNASNGFAEAKYSQDSPDFLIGLLFTIRANKYFDINMPFSFGQVSYSVNFSTREDTDVFTGSSLKNETGRLRASFLNIGLQISPRLPIQDFAIFLTLGIDLWQTIGNPSLTGLDETLSANYIGDDLKVESTFQQIQIPLGGGFEYAIEDTHLFRLSVLYNFPVFSKSEGKDKAVFEEASFSSTDGTNISMRSSNRPLQIGQLRVLLGYSYRFDSLQEETKVVKKKRSTETVTKTELPSQDKTLEGDSTTAQTGGRE